MVEMAPSLVLFEKTLHPYTQALLSAIPVPDPDYAVDRVLLQGELTSPINPQPGCRFAKRCPYASEACTKHDIPLKEVAPGHFVACTLV